MSPYSSMKTKATELLPPPSNQTPLLTLVWLKERRREQDAHQIVKSMLSHACGPYGIIATTGGDAQLAWGLLRPERFAPLTCWSIYVDGTEVCLFEGDMYDDYLGIKLLPGENPELAHQVAIHMQEHPEQRVSGLNGMYSGIYVNRDHSCAYLFGDVTGTRPVFWLSDEKRFIVSGNLWAFRGCDGSDRRWDTMALMEHLTIGFPLAGRTWLAGVNHLQRGRQVRSFVDGRTDVRMLLSPVFRQSWSIERSVQVLREAMDETLQRICRRLDRPVGLGLSGGLDSRLLLASLSTQRIDHHSFTFCLNPEEKDHRTAQAAARLLGEEHRTAVLDSTIAGALHQDIRLINEGESPGFGYLLLAAYAQQEANTLMIGYPGDVYAGAPPGPFRPLFLKNQRALAKCMLRTHMSQFPSEQAYRVLAPSYRVAWQEVLDEWFDSFEKIEQPSMMDVYLDHMTDYRLQRRTRLRIEAARWFCLPIYPYMDEQLYTTYRSLPLAHLNAERAHLALLCDYKTGLENLPSPARSFIGIPIHQEYRYRHFIHCIRVMRQKFALPLHTRWEEKRGTWGFGRSALNPLREAELYRLKHCQLFHWPEVNTIIEEARRGAFVNRNAMNRLISIAVVHDFLFNDGFSAGCQLQFLESSREIVLQPVDDTNQNRLRTAITE